ALWRFAAHEEDVNRDAAARIPEARDAEPERLDGLEDIGSDPHGAVLVEGTMIAEREAIQLQRLALDQVQVGDDIDRQHCEVGLTRHRTKRCEFRDREPLTKQITNPGVWDGLEDARGRRRRNLGLFTK